MMDKAGFIRWQIRQSSTEYILQLNNAFCLQRPLAAAVRSIILCFLIRLMAIKQLGNSLL